MPTARDGYREYFTEKLWEWLPAIYREQDALEGPGLPNNTLRALIESLADQAAVLKRDQDRLWDDGFVELADDWAIPYLAELLATRLVSIQNPRARRIDVAKTVYYRRRKGTLPVLEQLIDDMSGWDGKVVEEFRRLARTPHALDGVLHTGRITATPTGGLADLRNVRGALLVDDPFGEFHFTPDVRKPGGAQASGLGRRGIAKLSVHIYRMQAVEFSGVQARRMIDLAGTRDGFTFDPSGRDIALFSANEPSKDWSVWRSADEWRLPRAMTCGLLGEAIFEIGDAAIAAVINSATIANLSDRQNAAEDLRKLFGMRFTGTLAGSALLTRLLKTMPNGAFLNAALPEIVAAALADDCGAVQLYPDSVQLGFNDGTTLERANVRAGQLPTFILPAATDLTGVTAVIDPQRGRMSWDIGANAASAVRTHYHVGMLGTFGAGGLEREIAAIAGATDWADGDSSAGIPNSGAVSIKDSSTFDSPPDVAALIACSIAAMEEQRPYIRLQADWQFTAAGDDRTLVLDGLWIGATAGMATAPALVLNGNFERVTLRYCTLDPGGVDAVNATLPAVGLIVNGFVEELVIERCILPYIKVQGSGGFVQNMILNDSVVQAPASSVVAIDLPRVHLSMRRSTLIAAQMSDLVLKAEWLDASDCIVAGRAEVADGQNGCFRFSARAPQSKVPHPYESVLFDGVGGNLATLFASLRFGDAAYVSLAPVAPQALLRGAEQGLEMGAFNNRALSIKHDSLSIKTDEYLPFGRLPNFIEEN